MGAHPSMELCINTLISVFRKNTHTNKNNSHTAKSTFLGRGAVVKIFQREESDEISRLSFCHSSSLEF